MAKTDASDPRSSASESPAWQRWSSWLLLAVPFLALLGAVLRSDRGDWPLPMVGDESTYLMAAQSLGFDLDFEYTEHDYQRFVETFDHQPEGLILQSSNGGKTLVFAKPLFYPVLLAPFIRIDGLRGVMLANYLLLGLTALVMARRLRHTVGVWAPALVSLLIFGSVTFAQVFWVHSDLMLTCLVALGLCLALDRRRGEEASQVDKRGKVGFCLLTIVALTRPVYATLLLPVVLFSIGRSRSFRKLVIPSLLLALVVLAFDLGVRGEPSSYSGERQGYYSYTGFPRADASGGPTAPAWQDRVAARGSNSWTGSNLLPFAFDLRQFVWNSWYLVSGRHVGLLPYFLPILILLFAYRPGEVRTTLLVAVIAGTAAFLILRPFNFYGGGGALANRYFLPFYAALWFLPGRKVRFYWLLAGALLAAPFLWRVWQTPDAFLKAADGRYFYVTPQAESLLPHETTQSHLKPAGKEDFLHGDFWIKPLTPNLTAIDDGATIRWQGKDEAQLLIGTELPLRDFELRFAAPSGSLAEVPKTAGAIGGAERRIDAATIVVPFTTRRPKAKHPMWWTDDDIYLYHLRLSPTAAPTIDLQIERIWRTE